MGVALSELGDYLEQCLQPGRFNDYCPNGLQVEGRDTVTRLATGVTACQQFLDDAIAWGADALLVHHGYFWRGEASPIVGMKRRRLAALLRNEVSLFAYHLPLDAHPLYGNNACLGRLMGIDTDEQQPLEPGSDDGIGAIGTLAAALPAAEFVASLERALKRPALHVGAAQDLVSCIAWCTGGAQDYIDAAVAAGADLFVTGEVSERTVHTAREEGIHFVAAGHHATERFGVQALGEHVAQALSLEHRFFDIDNPA